MQALLQRALVETVERGERAEPERLSDDGRVLDGGLLVGVEQVEPRGDQPLDRLRNPLDSAAFAQHSHELLGIERIAAGAREQFGVPLGEGRVLIEEISEELVGLAVRERSERHGQGIWLAAAPAGPACEQLGTSGTNDKQRDAGCPIDQVVDEIQEVVVGPVQILEDEHERPTLREPLEKPTPSSEGLIPTGTTTPFHGSKSDQGPQMGLDPRLIDDRRELPLALFHAVAFKDPGLRFDHLPESPERDPVPVGQATAASP